MSDGGRENETVNENELRKKEQTGSDDFGRAISRIAVAQICENTGFECFHESTLDALSDIVIRYLLDLGKTAHFYANLAGRVECNIFDVIQGLEDLGISQRFTTSSSQGNCLIDSAPVREIQHYVNVAEETPFGRTITHFPIIRNLRHTPSFLQMGETPASKHIPAWLPAFPDPHTYIHTPVWNERKTDPRMDKIEQARQRRKAERSLLSLQQRLASTSSEAPVDLRDDDSEKADHVHESDLAPPIEAHDKEKSNPIVPLKIQKDDLLENQISVLDTFAPAIEAAKSGFSDLGDGERKTMPNKRLVLHLKSRVGKKPLGMPIDLNLQMNGTGYAAAWFGRDGERDDKKRRAEQILKDSIDRQHDIS